MAAPPTSSGASRTRSPLGGGATAVNGCGSEAAALEFRPPGSPTRERRGGYAGANFLAQEISRSIFLFLSLSLYIYNIKDLAKSQSAVI
jgi:hypothetical protein